MIRSKLLSLLGSLVFVLGIWFAMVKVGQIPAWQLPSPFDVGKEIWLSIQTETFWSDVRATVSISVIGFSGSIVIGVGLATALYFLPLFKKLLLPLLLISQNIPVIVMAPLFVLWFGFGIVGKVIIVMFVCFFPITISLMDAFDHVEENKQRYLTMMGATRWQQFRYLAFPSAVPVLFSSCKVSATYSVMGAVVAEWLGTEHGLGMMMTQAASSFRTDRVFVVILAIIFFSMCFYSAIRLSERWWSRKRGLE
jgi:ABC-type nitrate/sulfonate/bicarbonate transport system permease component